MDASTSRTNNGKKNSSTSEITHVPFRSAGGASTGFFAKTRVHHFIPMSPMRKPSNISTPMKKNTEPEKDYEKEVQEVSEANESTNKLETSNDSNEKNENLEIREDVTSNDKDSESDQQSSHIPTDESHESDDDELSSNSDKTGPLKRATFQYVTLERENSENEWCGELSNQPLPSTCNDSQDEKQQQSQSTSLEMAVEDDVNDDTSDHEEHEQRSIRSSSHNSAADEMELGDLTKVNASFASDFSCEMDRMTSSRNSSLHGSCQSFLLPKKEEDRCGNVEKESSESQGSNGGIKSWEKTEIIDGTSNGDGDGTESALSVHSADLLETNIDNSAFSVTDDGADSCTRKGSSSSEKSDVSDGGFNTIGAAQSPWKYSIGRSLNSSQGVDDSDTTLTSFEYKEPKALGATQSPWKYTMGTSINSSQSVDDSNTTCTLEAMQQVIQNAAAAIDNSFVTDAKKEKEDIDLQLLKEAVIDAKASGLPRNDSGSDESPAALRSPWEKYLEVTDNMRKRSDSDFSSVDSSGYVSSLTNQSCSLSTSTCASAQSPTLQHLEYLAKNSTAAYVKTFAPKIPDEKKRTLCPLESVSIRVSLQELRDIYGCRNRRDAMKLAFDQSNCLAQASDILVDLLFQYLHEHCSIPTRLFRDKNKGGRKNSRIKSKSTPSRKGLSLPAAAIGWLSSQLYPGESDQQYQQLWQDNQDENCLPNASPTPQLLNKLSTLKILLEKHITHLRITNAPWPGPLQKRIKQGNSENRTFHNSRSRGRMLLNFDGQTTSAFLRFFRGLQNQPRLDMKLFPNVEYLQVDGIPPEWVHNLNVTNESLVKMTVQRGYLRNVSNLFGVNNKIMGNSGKHQFDEAHEAIFQKGAYDDILGLTTNQMSPILRLPAPFPRNHRRVDTGLSGRNGNGDDDGAIFPSLAHLTLSRCGISDLSGLAKTANAEDIMQDGGVAKSPARTALSFLEGLVSLDLSHNELVQARSALEGVDKAIRLSAIDLSHNRLSSMHDSHMLLGNVKVLILANNSIKNVQGLDRLYSLTTLDLKNNELSNLCDVSSLAKLPDLMDLNLSGNPLVTRGKRRFRTQILALFKDARLEKSDYGLTYRELMNLLPRVDGKVVTKKELVMLKYLSFSQTVINDIPVVNSSIDIIKKSEDEGISTIDDLAQQLMEPFREDYEVEKSVQNPLALKGPSRRQVTRKAPRNPAVITNMSKVETRRSSGQRKQGTRAKVKLRKQDTHKYSHVLPGLYLTIENVVQSIIPDISPLKDQQIPENECDILESMNTEAQNMNNVDDLDERQNGETEENHAVPPGGMVVPKALPRQDGQNEASPYMEDGNYIHIQRDKAVTLNALIPPEDNDLALVGTLGIDLKKNVDEETISLCGTEIAGNLKKSCSDESSEFEAAIIDDEKVQFKLDDSNVVAVDKMMVSNSVTQMKLEGTDLCVKNTKDNGTQSDSASCLDESISSEQNGSTMMSKTITDLEENVDKESSSLCETEAAGNMEKSSQDGTSEFESLRVKDEDKESLVSTSHTFNSTTSDEQKSLKSGPERIDFAFLESSAIFHGPDSYAQLHVAKYFELYFRCHVFPSTSHNESIDLYEDNDQEMALPQIQLYQSDRDLMMWAISQNRERQNLASNLYNISQEQLVHVSREFVLPCGAAATGRVQPVTGVVRDKKGNILYETPGNPFSVSEGQQLIFCVSNKAVYLIPDFSGSSKEDRRFPSPISLGATFSDALWPHAYCRHPLKYLRKITFDGYGFQRLTLFFKLPALRGAVYIQPENGLMSAFDYTYVLFTCNQKDTIKLLQKIQEAAKEASPNDNNGKSGTLIVENDNTGTMKAISRALAQENVGDDILHYQILHQTWQSYINGNARRSFILTNDHVFLFNETYAGDLSGCGLEEDIHTVRYGDMSMRTIASAGIEDIADVSIAKDDPKMVHLMINSQSRLRRNTCWSLLCYNHENAERLVDALRKARKAST